MRHFALSMAAALVSLPLMAEPSCAMDPVGTYKQVEGGNHLKLAVYSWGKQDGPPILFIHGTTQSHLIWNRQYASDLAKDFRIVALDLRGHGESEKPLDEAAYNTAEYNADDINAVIKSLNLKKPFVVSWSGGGFVICDYLRKYGDGDLSGLGFIASSTKRGVPSAANFKGAGSSTGSAAGNLRSERSEENITGTLNFVKSMAAKPLPRDEYARIVAFNMQVPPNVRSILSVRNVDNGDVLEKVKVPTALFYGAKDVVVNPKATSQYILSTIRGSKLFWYEDAGHLLFVDDADRFNADLKAFVQQANRAL
ncbi:alpha/beta fold hydrolase [Neorhizobium sp. DT-125]|uniref:alpha/beta fold hydrolase n=1 Tax=Neorhizobium sp. DT-125 TaxID=3396163 RepID=UPI003F1A0BFD